MKALKQDIQKLGRLKKRSDFLCVREKGRKWVSKSAIVQICVNEGQGLRVGFTVTKRVSKSAVHRNRIKRRLRAIAFDVLPLYAGGNPNLDVVLIGRQETYDRSYDDLVKDLKWCFKRLECFDGTAQNKPED